MNKLNIVLGVVIVVSMLSGCFVEPGEGASIGFDGSFNVTDEEFEMDGQLWLGGGAPAQGEYRVIRLELYAENGTLLYEEDLGTLHNRSDRLDVSVSLRTVPYYVVFNSSDIWDGETAIDYYVRSQDAYQGYQLNTATEREELPIDIT